MNWCLSNGLSSVLPLDCVRITATAFSSLVSHLPAVSGLKNEKGIHPLTPWPTFFHPNVASTYKSGNIIKLKRPRKIVGAASIMKSHLWREYVPSFMRKSNLPIIIDVVLPPTWNPMCTFKISEHSIGNGTWKGTCQCRWAKIEGYLLDRPSIIIHLHPILPNHISYSWCKLLTLIPKW